MVVGVVIPAAPFGEDRQPIEVLAYPIYVCGVSHASSERRVCASAASLIVHTALFTRVRERGLCELRIDRGQSEVRRLPGALTHLGP
jgi:hypothetical protein